MADLPPTPDKAHAERVLAVEHFTGNLFSFSLSRNPAFRFRSGEFVMIALPGEKPVWRAYSITSPAWADSLEFYSIIVPDDAGALTRELKKIKKGDTVWVGKKPTGTLVLDALLPGKRLWLLATGTGVAPFASLIRDPETYEKFESVILVHTCRELADLAYSQGVVAATISDPLVGEAAGEKLAFLPTTTREESPLTGRITTLIENGGLFAAAGVAQKGFDAACDRVMICGSAAMLGDISAMVAAAGLTEGANAKPGEFVVEKAFAG